MWKKCESGQVVMFSGGCSCEGVDSHQWVPLHQRFSLMFGHSLVLGECCIRMCEEYETIYVLQMQGG